MPKITHTCPKCNGEMRPLYRREIRDNVRDPRWARIPGAFYCPGCIAVVTFPFDNGHRLQMIRGGKYKGAKES